MKIFTCGSCSGAVYFENTACMSCGADLGFVPDTAQMVSLDADGSATLVGGGTSTRYVKCSHHAQDNGCNWMIRDGDNDPFCVSCRLNNTIPDLDVPGHRELWHRLEAEKRRLVFTCLRAYKRLVLLNMLLVTIYIAVAVASPVYFLRCAPNPAPRPLLLPPFPRFPPPPL